MEAPTTLRAGDSLAWDISLPAYPASAGWALKYRLLFPSGTAVDIATTGVGDIYSVALTAANTAGWTTGAATLLAYLEKGSGPSLERVTLSQQSVTVLPDLHAAATLDNRSQAVKALADARTALAAYMANGQAHVAEYEIAGRRMKFRIASEITDLITYYEREVAKERVALAVQSGASPGRVLTRF